MHRIWERKLELTEPCRFPESLILIECALDVTSAEKFKFKTWLVHQPLHLSCCRMKLLFRHSLLLVILALNLAQGVEFRNRSKAALKFRYEGRSAASPEIEDDPDPIPNFIQPRKGNIDRITPLLTPKSEPKHDEDDDKEYIMGFPPKMQKQEKDQKLKKAETRRKTGGSSSSNNDDTDEEYIMGFPIHKQPFIAPTNDSVYFKWFMETYFNRTNQETHDALKQWYGEDAKFKDIVRILYQLAGSGIQYRTYSEPCVVPSEEIQVAHPKSAEFYPEAFQVRPGSQKHSWRAIFQERDLLSGVLVRLIKHAAEQGHVVGNFQSSLDQTLVILRNKKSKQEVNDLAKKLRYLLLSVGLYCDPSQYLMCNPFFKSRSQSLKGQRQFSQELLEDSREGRPIYGHCDCRPGFTNVGSKCFVKELEDCLLYNLLEEFDIKIMPYVVRETIKSPPCKKGLECVNGLVCFKSGGSPLSRLGVHLIGASFLVYLLK